MKNCRTRNTLIITLTLALTAILVNCGSTGDPTPDPNPGDGNAELPASIRLLSITGGTFTMGGTTMANDAPEVSVTLSDFSISEKEISNAEYIDFLNAANAGGWLSVQEQTIQDPCGSNQEFVVLGAGSAPNSGQVFLQLGETGGCTSDGHAEDIDNKSWIQFDQASETFSLIDNSKSNWPVNWVRWYGAYAFTQYYGIDLPSEAQWEYAARGGQQLEYPTDDGSLNQTKANYNGDLPGVLNETGHSVATGSYPANPYGLYDMGGNVWEWCIDYYDAGFYTSNATDPLNSTANADGKRVRRGGSWNYHSATLLTYARAGDLPERGNNHFGFRIVVND